MVGMGLDDRAKLRRLLVSLGGPDAIQATEGQEPTNAA
jgi:hypothetical protein